MPDHKIKFRVRYAETDQMGYVYYGNYAQYFEMGRVEWLRNKGITYKEMEDNGIILPVIVLNINYHQPAKYDDHLTLTTTLIKKPLLKIEFDYQLQDENRMLLTTGNTTLVFVNKNNMKPTKAPNYLLEKLEGLF
ncbi:MAG: thioesterase [Flavobacteriales bacterium]|nr:MAG: thioesterase [Flavobacteriales bacterium]